MKVYTDITDVPLDEYTTPDVVDVEDAKKGSLNPRIHEPVEWLANSSATHSSYVIPYKRALRVNSKGQDVVGAKRAIWRALGLEVPKHPTPLFGPIARNELNEFKEKHGLRRDGVLDRATLVKLAPSFDAYAFLLYVGYPPNLSARAQKQHAFMAYMLWGYNNRGLIAYAQYRPMAHLLDLSYLPRSEDCSTWFTKGGKSANFPDPNGSNYNGLGWTGTIAAHGKTVLGLDKAQVGDAILYGPAPNYEHVAGYIGGGRVCSLGSSPGPLILNARYRGDLHLIKRFI